jgi:nickel/cobalt transporter (NiCoT) family protein
VLLYKPWRRHIDKKRTRNAHFEPLPQSGDVGQDEVEENPTKGKDGSGGTEIIIEPVEATDIAGPAGSSAPR